MAAEYISYHRQATTAEGSTHLSIPEDGRKPPGILPANQKDHSICRLCRCSSRSSCRISLHKWTTQRTTDDSSINTYTIGAESKSRLRAAILVRTTPGA